MHSSVPFSCGDWLTRPAGLEFYYNMVITTLLGMRPGLLQGTLTTRALHVAFVGPDCRYEPVSCLPCLLFSYEDSKTVSVCLYLKKRNRPSFINISPTLVIDTSMERSSRAWKPKNWKFFQISLKLNFVCTQRKEINLASSISVLHQ